MLWLILIQHLIKFNKIKISSFGTFEVINKKERIGRNPKTGEIIYVPKKNKARFRASKKLKELINK